MNPKIQIDELSILDNFLNLSLKIEFKSPNEYNPYLEIIFSNSIENRRIPFKIRSFFRDNISNNCFILANETFEINHIFWNKDFIDDINISISLVYGNEFIEEFLIDKTNSDFNFTLKDNDYDPKIENNLLKLEARKDILKKKRNNRNKFTYKSISFFESFFLFILSILAFPIFFIDGFLTSKGLKNKSPFYLKGKSTFKSILLHVNWKTLTFSGFIYGKRSFKIAIMKFLYIFFRRKKIKENKILFLSERRNDLSGNFEAIFDIFKTNDKLEISKFLIDKKIKNLSFSEMITFVNSISTSKIILLDDFYPNIHNFHLKKGIKLFQLWHAVGAFKTFGFSRLGKSGAANQDSPNHRSYDYAIVSSKNIKRFYSEGFGISDEKVIVTGIPRTDIFFDEEYGEKIINKIYKEYPILKNKKIILFAPTFRGEGKDDAYYPKDKFNIETFFDLLEDIDKDDYLSNCILIVKHHPFIKERINIPKKYKDRVLDLSKYTEINDLLFITDLLITDYSSVIFEASILNIPMLFYSYDLKEYSKDRGFYFDYRIFVPGKIVFNFKDLVKAIYNNDFEIFKVQKFKNMFFNDFDGKSSHRVADLILNEITKEWIDK